jgi:hypothetical protein
MGRGGLGGRVPFAEENDLLVLFVPATQKVLVFRVVAVNKNVVEYGSLPIPAGTALPTFEGGSVTVPADGVLPGRSYLQTGITFPHPDAYDPTDMLYLPADDRDTLLHVRQEVSPAWIRIDVQIPKGVTQGRMLKKRLVAGVDRDFGFSRGIFEAVHIPRVHYGYRYANDSNADAYTYARLVVAEYTVEVPKSPELIFDAITKRARAIWVTMPINYVDPAVSSALSEAYGFDGFRLYSVVERDKALAEIREVLKKSKV